MAAATSAPTSSTRLTTAPTGPSWRSRPGSRWPSGRGSPPSGSPPGGCPVAARPPGPGDGAGGAAWSRGAAAARVAQEAGRPLVDGSALAALPLVAPVLAFGAAVSEGEPLPRALAGAVGSAVGADLGSRAGLAACGGEAAATQGAGLIVCPTLSAVGGALGAQAGRAAALHVYVYDEIAGPPVRPEPATRPGPRPGSGG